MTTTSITLAVGELSEPTQTKYAHLRQILAEMGDVIIGMSGGVDSVLLSKVAHDVLDEKALAVTADSPSLPRRELREAESMARMAGIRHQVIATQEVFEGKTRRIAAAAQANAGAVAGIAASAAITALNCW